MTIDSIIINDQYIVLIGISILFTMLAIYRRGILLDALAWVCWFITAATHLLASPTSTPLYSISLLYWGIGLIFFVLMWVDIYQVFVTTKANKGVL